MKILAILLLLVLSTGLGFAIDVVLPDKPTEPERFFVQALVAAFQKGDGTKFIELTHWKKEEGVPFYLPDFYRDLIGRKAAVIRLARVAPATHTEHIDGSDLVRESLPVSWEVTIMHPSQHDYEQNKTVLDAGSLDGLIRLTTSYAIPKKG
jgi:hypothetical protein